MRHQKGFLRNSGKGKKRTYWKRCFFFRYMVYLHETQNSEDSFADMKGSHLEVEVDAAKSWADIGRVAGSLRNCQVTKSVPSWSLSIFGISSFMNHQPWLLLFKPFWVIFSLSPNRKSQLTQGWGGMFTSVSLPLSMTSALSLHLFPKGPLSRKEQHNDPEKPTVSAPEYCSSLQDGTMPTALLRGQPPDQFSHLGFYFMAHTAFSVETIIPPTARVLAISLTFPSRVFLAGPLVENEMTDSVNEDFLWLDSDHCLWDPFLCPQH